MSTAAILALSIGVPLVYLLGAGVVYALCPKRWDATYMDILGTRLWVTVLWPLVVWPLLAVRVTNAVVEWNRTRRDRSTLPKATARRVP